MKLLHKRFIVLLVAIVDILSTLTAQSVKTHIVERGETLASIAQKFGVTQAKIIELNPATAQFVYVGMELKIPQQEGTQQEIVPKVTTTPEPSSPLYDSKLASTSSVGGSENTLSDFSSFKLHYLASFKDFEHGSYGFGFHLLGMYESPFGVTFNMYSNAGLIDVQYATVGTSFGPNVGVNISDYFAFFAPFTCNLSWAGQGPGKDNLKFGWGLMLQPTGALRLGSFVISAGLPISFNPKAGKRTIKSEYGDIEVKGGNKFTVGLELAVGFNF